MKFSLGISLVYASQAFAALDPTTLAQHLANAADLLGPPRTSGGLLTKWMASIDDTTPIENMTIPGTHDSAAWNITGVTAPFVKTQDKPLFDQLDAGIRLFDFRIGLNGQNINMYHGSSLLSSTATLEDVFWGLYSWIDQHPTETLLISVKVDNGTSGAAIQQPVYNLVTTGTGADYWLQTDALGTLGSSRGKLYLLRRMSFDALTDAKPMGIPASSGWADNNPSFVITNGAKSISIEDFYDVPGGTIPPSVDAKFAAVSAHLDAARASQDRTTQLFITFASGYSGLSVTPEMLAAGNTTNQTPGVNTKVMGYLQAHRGEHLGIILYDFFASEYGLINATLGYDVTAPPPGSTSLSPYPTSTPKYSAATQVVVFPACFIAGAVITMLISL